MKKSWIGHKIYPISVTLTLEVKYDKQDQQGKAAFNELNPHMTQQQEPMAKSPGGPKNKPDRAKT
jgi:hypothetical protein